MITSCATNTKLCIFKKILTFDHQTFLFGSHSCSLALHYIPVILAVVAVTAMQPIQVFLSTCFYLGTYSVTYIMLSC